MSLITPSVGRGQTPPLTLDIVEAVHSYRSALRGWIKAHDEARTHELNGRGIPTDVSIRVRVTTRKLTEARALLDGTLA